MLTSIANYLVSLLGSKVPAIASTVIAGVTETVDPMINAELTKLNVDPAKAEAVVTAVLALVTNVTAAVSTHVATASATTPATQAVVTKAV